MSKPIRSWADIAEAYRPVAMQTGKRSVHDSDSHVVARHGDAAWPTEAMTAVLGEAPSIETRELP
jgi:hypothetical protein